MSQDLARFKEPDTDSESKRLLLTAFVGGDDLGRAVQFTIGHEYACLSEQQTEALIELLQRRLDGTLSATAGDWEELQIEVNADKTQESESR